MSGDQSVCPRDANMMLLEFRALVGLIDQFVGSPKSDMSMLLSGYVRPKVAGLVGCPRWVEWSQVSW